MVLKFYCTTICAKEPQENGEPNCTYRLRYAKKVHGIYNNFHDIVVLINSFNTPARLWVREDNNFRRVLRFPLNIDKLTTEERSEFYNDVFSDKKELSTSIELAEEQFQELAEKNKERTLELAKIVSLEKIQELQEDTESIIETTEAEEEIHEEECEICRAAAQGKEPDLEEEVVEEEVVVEEPVEEPLISNKDCENCQALNEEEPVEEFGEFNCESCESLNEEEQIYIEEPVQEEFVEEEATFEEPLELTQLEEDHFETVHLEEEFCLACQHIASCEICQRLEEHEVLYKLKDGTVINLLEQHVVEPEEEQQEETDCGCESKTTEEACACEECKCDESEENCGCTDEDKACLDCSECEECKFDESEENCGCTDEENKTCQVTTVSDEEIHCELCELENTELEDLEPRLFEDFENEQVEHIEIEHVQDNESWCHDEWCREIVEQAEKPEHTLSCGCDFDYNANPLVVEHTHEELHHFEEEQPTEDLHVHKLVENEGQAEVLIQTETPDNRVFNTTSTGTCPVGKTTECSQLQEGGCLSCGCGHLFLVSNDQLAAEVQRRNLPMVLDPQSSESYLSSRTDSEQEYKVSWWSNKNLILWFLVWFLLAGVVVLIVLVFVFYARVQ
ncbi:hypothetical protein [Mycoplasma sp. 1654_15]|uniref:hypothetical protein n=1 Tax=Mycoplasma sp. 1654_15 TaxID=2725994 RepID=UPI0014499EB8|nr:hypothetical protein [Mycoplasma sp. 1654_15]QJB71170.1 hypothetical protein HF996_01540 [Mycoplasma sp. 1654_15]